MGEMVTAIGLMSGTSLDGVDVAVLRTDGEQQVKTCYAKTFLYPEELRRQIKAILNVRDEGDPWIKAVELAVTRVHAQACQEALEQFPETTLIGFHGQTIWHAPEEGLTRQIGDGQLLADMTKRQVVYDFRSEDMRNGGQGAPLLPLYHAARAHGLPRPIAVVNIGGVANVTWIGTKPDDILAFDTGPGNALINDWMELKCGEALDRGGMCAAKGVPNKEWIKKQILNPYLRQKPPKSLDRNAFSIEGMDKDFVLADGAATLTSLTNTCIFMAQRYFPSPALFWIITGGGRHNTTMMKELKKLLADSQIVSAEAVNWNGDSLEAEGFAYLAVRCARGLPISLPQTTGCKTPSRGGIIVQPRTMSGVA